MDTNAFMEEVLARLTRIESALAVGHSHGMSTADCAQVKEALRGVVQEEIAAFFGPQTSLASPISQRQDDERRRQEANRKCEAAKVRRAAKDEVRQKAHLKKMEQPLAGQLLDPWDAAAVLGVTIDTLAVWRGTKRGPKYIKIGRSVRYKGCDLEEYTEAKNRSLNPPASSSLRPLGRR